MILTPYVYKVHLPLSDRLAIAQTYVRFDGYHGLVTELATDFQTNLKPIYAIEEDVFARVRSPVTRPQASRSVSSETTHRNS